MRISILAMLLISGTLSAQSITGRWTTIDDVSEKEKSVVEIFERNNKLYGKIIKIFTSPGEDPDPVCDKCPPEDDRYNKKIIGMEIIRDMQKDGNEYDEGHILDPEVGKIYRCKLWIDGNMLKVRGYWGPFYRTQSWKRAN